MMYQEVADALRPFHFFKRETVEAFLRTAYGALLIAADSSMTSDHADDDDMNLMVSGALADWRAKEGGYPDADELARISHFTGVFLAEIWVHLCARQAARARDERGDVLLALVTAWQTPRTPGRPSTGRSQRIQAMIPPDLAIWLDSQRAPHETMSDAVNRLLNEARTGAASGPSGR